MTVAEQARRAREASKLLAKADGATRSSAVLRMAERLVENAGEILSANEEDVAGARERGVRPELLDRLQLSERRIEEMAEGLRQVAGLPDPIGEVIERWQQKDGLWIEKVRVPFGVVGMVYESRPNVTADAAGLVVKAGSAAVLRGGTDALRSNRAIVRALRRALADSGLPEDAVTFIDDPDRRAVDELLTAKGLVDVVIPRGGAGLIQHVVETATVPVIETGVGNCHLYVDEAADLHMALELAVNAKTQRPGVCNAIETLLVHEKIAADFLPRVVSELRERGVEIRGCPKTREVVPDVVPATEEDWWTEYLGLTLAVRVVADVEAAVEHINRYGTRHSEAIVTENREAAEIFLRDVDAAAVYHNASTRFTDGFQFGFGAEIGISTQKLHARGPMGLKELTTYKYVVRGNGQIRS
ncbi:MAG: glutamate-5-semialdehyde dehydrogenase [Alicyclobacillaceae bacterium]|nr:glutamate-5-semialdehyde dehydrogenase [Alicyclobacillaceae bacterium]